MPRPLTGGLILRYLAVIPAALAALVFWTCPAKAWPAWWYSQAMCIHRFESTDWHATLDWRGYPSRDHGGMQIDVSTWASFAPRSFPSDPAAATPQQQLLVAWRIWLANGRRWGGQWPNTSRSCHLY